MKTEVKSPVAGSLSVQFVDDGAPVAEGDDIGELELMKTLWRVVAPVAGRLRWLVGPGVIVAEGEVIAEIES